MHYTRVRACVCLLLLFLLLLLLFSEMSQTSSLISQQSLELVSRNLESANPCVSYSIFLQQKNNLGNKRYKESTSQQEKQARRQLLANAMSPKDIDLGWPEKKHTHTHKIEVLTCTLHQVALLSLYIWSQFGAVGTAVLRRGFRAGPGSLGKSTTT